MGVLKNKNIIFFPELSLPKQEAINKLDMGLLNIFAMQFKTFWPGDCHAFFLPDSHLCSMFLNAKRFTNLPILISYFGGIKGRALETIPDKILIEKMIAHLRYFFGKKVSYPNNYFITRWFMDNFSYGSYSYLPVSATPHHREILAESENNKLFFAGEATMIKFPATVHGAYLSGIREANKVKQLFF